jgi:Positive regulator of sigma E activity
LVECGKVIKEGKKNAVTVSFDRKSACDQCRMCAVSKSGKTVEVVLDNKLGAKVGDTVLVQMGDRFVLTAALIVYLIPLVLVALGLFLGSLVSETLALILVFIGLIIGFTIAAVLDKMVLRKKKGFVPEMTKILEESTKNTEISEKTSTSDEKTATE